jgi:peptidoglycan/LPS O-acetylase OafA/YrhL
VTALQTTFEAPAIELSPRRTGHRLPALDALRLVAAVAVVAFHFTAYPAPQWGRAVSEVFPSLGALTSYGAFGVQLFFVISGFVILMSAWGRTIPSFVASRVSRIYPAYWTAVILAVFLFRVLWPEGKQVSLHQALVNLTMMQTGFGVSDVDGVYWTLWTELCFYIIIAVFMRVGITTSRVLVFCAAWPLLSTFAAGSDNALVVSFFMPRHAALFAGGMVLHVIYREGRSLIAGLVLALDVIVAGHATYAGWFHKVEVNTGRDLPDATVWLVVLACFGLVALATLSPLRNVRSRWLTRLGLLTYPLYLVHQYWGLWIIQHLYPALPGRLVVGIAFAATVLLALAVHHLVERRFATPFRRALEGSLRRLGAAARPARS